ncbi:hypothetical protein HELRODRAFT_171452 [Helobdella robusta]|uniref:Uncharacterized protein n=1 Tax=Helobdella robusta TaxID=6412 RepID=T1F4A8_HELRO|nr:hypothetical protein HELRODRAFT_171452 [Helobdella robusta]ESO05781.1 hypothetical protein HELRODRAFT_171452 [Helobdella robusta]
MVLKKSPRGGKRYSPVTIVNQRIDECYNCSVEKMPNNLEPIMEIGKVKSPESRTPSPPNKYSGVSVKFQQILACLRSFPKVTFGGRDGLAPEHVTSSKTDSLDFINGITAFINLLLNVGCLAEVALYLFG